MEPARKKKKEKAQEGADQEKEEGVNERQFGFCC